MAVVHEKNRAYFGYPLALVNQAYQRFCANGHQIYRGSVVMKVDDMQVYSRQAKVVEFFLGDRQIHKEIIAKRLISQGSK
jgi:alkylation response protein AidB-like acyl-CoA dehydrogenase